MTRIRRALGALLVALTAATASACAGGGTHVDWHPQSLRGAAATKVKVKPAGKRDQKAGKKQKGGKEARGKKQGNGHAQGNGKKP